MKNKKMNWRPEVQVEGKFQFNSLIFATKEEAETYARDLFNRWFLCTGHRAVEVDAETNPVNYKLVDSKLIPLEN